MLDPTERFYQNKEQVEAVLAREEIPQDSSTTAGWQVKGVVDGDGELRPALIRVIITNGPEQVPDSGDAQPAPQAGHKRLLERDKWMGRVKVALQADARWAFEQTADDTILVDLDRPAPRYPLNKGEQAHLNLWMIVYATPARSERNLVAWGRAEIDLEERGWGRAEVDDAPHA